MSHPTPIIEISTTTRKEKNTWHHDKKQSQ